MNLRWNFTDDLERVADDTSDDTVANGLSWARTVVANVRYSFNRRHRMLTADLLRDIFSPFEADDVLPRYPGSVDALAEAAYEERNLPAGRLDNTRLAVLADALEESGCQDATVLGHLREQEAVHVRGCFALDLILGKR
jgi:hypothetical protein